MILLKPEVSWATLRGENPERFDLLYVHREQHVSYGLENDLRAVLPTLAPHAYALVVARSEREAALRRAVQGAADFQIITSVIVRFAVSASKANSSAFADMHRRVIIARRATPRADGWITNNTYPGDVITTMTLNSLDRDVALQLGQLFLRPGDQVLDLYGTGGVYPWLAEQSGQACVSLEWDSARFAQANRYLAEQQAQRRLPGTC